MKIVYLMQNIKNNRKSRLKLVKVDSEYFDFKLYSGGVKGVLSTSGYTCAQINAYGIGSDNKLYSNYVWSNAVNEGVVLNDIGFVGVDNGFISYDKNKITNREFLALYTGSTYEISEDKKMLFLSPIKGNTLHYSYNMSVEEDDTVGKYFAFKGGFYQGFFKLEGFEYQTLPKDLNSGWCLDFVLRKRSDYNIPANSLSGIHPENNGIFFFMGTRAENKFWHYYKVNEEIMERYRTSTGDTDHVTNCQFLEKEETRPIYCDEPYAIDEDVWLKDVQIDGSMFNTSDGISADAQGYFEIETDNKYILFNRTDNGFTVDNWEEGSSMVLTGQTRNLPNLYPIMNRTATGYTVDDIEKLYETEQEDYDVIKDAITNAFALKVGDDGSIGYKMSVIDCSGDTHYDTISGCSKAGLIKDGEWSHITVNIVSNTSTSDYRHMKRMRLYFYVNGDLVFITKELPVFNFKALNEAYQKQEGVPYNISLGGGTQGLLEEIFPDYYAMTQYALPLERDFAGTFYGDLKSFSFFDTPFDYNMIKTI